MLKTVLLVGVISAGVVHAETRRFYDAPGRFEGRAESQGSTTRCYDRDGRTTGRSEVGSGGITRRYDKERRFIGETRR